MELTYTESFELPDGTTKAVQRTVPVPEGRVLGENQAHYGAAYFPIEGVTLPPGGIWHFDPIAAAESARIRVLSDDEIAARAGKAGRVRTKAQTGSDPVTGLGAASYAAATGPLPQVAKEEDEA
jgi:hypothetical protein